jgi:LysM repeat protein
MTGRPQLVLAPLAAAIALGAGSANAQSRCGAGYTIEPGDTLYSISQRCRVSLSLIYDLNPQVDTRSLQVGARLRLEGEESAGGDSPPEDAAPGDDDRATEGDVDGRYTVREGDTPYSIAQALGISVIELLNQNPDLRPYSMAVGEILDLPTDDPGAAFSISPASGTAGSEVTIRAANLRPDDYVTVGVGRRSSEWRAIRQVQADGNGRVNASVQVPRRYGAGDELIFVLDTDRGVTLKSGVFRVTAGEDDDSDRVALEGRVLEGVECPVLRTPDGDRYALVSSEHEFTEGEYVEIEGERADMSFCQQGRATIDVDELREVPPPNDGGGNGGDDGAEGRLSAAFLRGAWASVEAGNCARPDFDIRRGYGGLTVETSLDGYASTGDVRAGGDAAMLFDQPGILLDLERAGRGEMRVSTPDGDPVQLGGHDVGGGGHVFLRC